MMTSGTFKGWGPLALDKLDELIAANTPLHEMAVTLGIGAAAIKTKMDGTGRRFPGAAASNRKSMLGAVSATRDEAIGSPVAKHDLTARIAVTRPQEVRLGVDKPPRGAERIARGRTDYTPAAEQIVTKRAAPAPSIAKAWAEEKAKPALIVTPIPGGAGLHKVEVDTGVKVTVIEANIEIAPIQPRCTCTEDMDDPGSNHAPSCPLWQVPGPLPAPQTPQTPSTESPAPESDAEVKRKAKNAKIAASLRATYDRLGRSRNETTSRGGILPPHIQRAPAPEPIDKADIAIANCEPPRISLIPPLAAQNLLNSLLLCLPAPGVEWPAAERVAWLQAAATIFAVVYPKADGDHAIEIKLHRFGALAK